jgi:endonuclease/exonuclease/phosphatase family metal-dependent hydrolase
MGRNSALQEKRGHLRVLSTNLCKGRADGEALGRQIEALDIDVIAVQELSAAQAGVISELLPHGKLEPTPERDGMGIALRHPGNVEHLPLHARDAQVVQLAPGEWPHLPEVVELVNVHIQAPHCPPVWGSLALRRNQIRALNSYLRGVPRPRRVVIGDFNSTPIWPAYRALGSHLDDAAKLNAGATRRRTARTWGPWYGAPRLLRIDHAFIRGLAVERFDVVEVVGSDHSGILTDLRIL